MTMTSKRKFMGQSRMARFYRSNRWRSKYAWRGGCEMFHVKHGTPSRLLPDTEIAKNHVENILDINPAREAAERIGSLSKLFGNNILPSHDTLSERSIERLPCHFQHFPMP